MAKDIAVNGIPRAFRCTAKLPRVVASAGIRAALALCACVGAASGAHAQCFFVINNEVVHVATIVTSCITVQQAGDLVIDAGGDVFAPGFDFGIQLTAPDAKLTMRSGSLVEGNGPVFSAILANGGTTLIGEGGGLDDVQVLADGANAAAVRAFNAGTQVTLNGATLRSTGDNSQRFNDSAVVYSASGSSVTIQNSFLFSSINPTVLGAGFDGAIADAGGRIEITNTAINVTHNGTAVGVAANDGSTVSLSGGAIAMVGTATAQSGVIASFSSTITAQGTAISVAAPSGRGIEAFSLSPGFFDPDAQPSSVTGTNLNLMLSGENSLGLVVGNNSTVDLSGSTVSVTGAGSYGSTVGGMENSRMILQANTGVTAPNGISALGDQDVGASSVFDVTIDASTVTATSGHALLADNSRGAFTIRNASTVTSGNGVLLQAINSRPDEDFVPDPFGPPPALTTIAELNIDGSTVTGDVVTDLLERGPTYGSVANVTLTNDSALTGAMHYASLVRIGGTSQWTMNNSSDVMSLANAGVVAFTGPVGGAFKTLNVHGNYAGSGGTLALNTQLGDDNSPTDRLIIDGGYGSGTTNVQVTNVGGMGGVTVADGIRIVDATNGATTAEGSFTLQGRAFAGPYEYFLFQGGSAASGGDPNDNDWYLRSEAPPPPSPDPEPEPPAPPPVPPDPPVPPIPPDPEPKPIPEPVVIYRPEVAAYLANARSAMGMFVHTLHERLGAPQFAETVRGESDDRVGSMWLRAVGRDIEIDPHTDFTFDVDGRLWLLQGGAEFAQFDLGNDAELYLGAMLGYGDAASKSMALGNPYHAKGEVEGYSGGLYGTWYANDAERLGLYIDVWGQYAELDNTLNSDGLPEVAYDSKATTGSIEIGYAWWASSNWFAIEPQLQVIYTDYEQDDLTEVNGTEVTDAARKITTGRLGVRFFAKSEMQTKHPVQPYLELNWWHDFQDERVSLNTIEFKRGVPLDRYEVGAGFTAQFADRWSAWLNVEWQFGSHDYRGIEGIAGIKYSW